jgi:hypothetical protein
MRDVAPLAASQLATKWREPAVAVFDPALVAGGSGTVAVFDASDMQAKEQDFVGGCQMEITEKADIGKFGVKIEPFWCKFERF